MLSVSPVAGWGLFLTLVLLLAAVGFVGPAGADEVIVAQWEFDKDGDLEGWKDNNHIRDAKVADGKLTVTVTDWDPFLSTGVLATPIVATPMQVIELRLNSPVEGTGEFFWTNTTETEYAGFSPGKETRFSIKPGWQVYRVRPFWQAEGKIIKLRLDLPGIKKGTEEERSYEIDYIRVIELGAPGAPVEANWDFGKGLQGWQVEGEGALSSKDGWLVADLKPDDRLIAPPVEVDAFTDLFLSFVMSVDKGSSGRVYWATAKANGVQQHDFPTLADGKPHVYNLALGASSQWQKPVIYLAFDPALGEACHVQVKWLRTTPEPSGPAEVEIQRFLLTDALPRVSQNCEVLVQVANRGGEALRNLRAELVLPEGLKMAEGEDRVKTLAELDFYEPRQITWRVVGSTPGEVRFRLVLGEPAVAEAEAVDRLLPLLNLPRADYVPEPKPVRGEYEVGVYYFPGWGSYNSWARIMPFPERKPVLGWYREGLPEVADWHIKWAVEHGITYFCYDWYWNQGRQSLTHALHEGFFNARYRHLMKFCLLWANHMGKGQHSPEDNVKVCQYWIDNYFKRPEYFKVNGRPMVVIFSVGALEVDLGIEGTRECIELWHRMTREAGCGEILVVGCGNPSNLQKMKDMGFDAVSGYNWPTCGVEGRNFVPYIEVARNQYDKWWMPMAAANLMPVIVPTSPGWDSRPWHGDKAFVLTQRTPEAFEEHLQLARKFVEGTGQPKIVLIEAWDEWGEGSYCQPHKEYGFGHVDAIRRVFCPDAEPHIDFGPADVGLGPYDFEAPKLEQTAWEFNEESNSEGWGPSMGLSEFKVADGVMQARATSNDPAFGCGVRLRASKFKTIEIRMAVLGASETDHCQLFWGTTLTTITESSSIKVPLNADGQMHTYRFDVGSNPLWRGLVNQLRFDPCSTQGALVSIDYIRALP